MIETTEVNIDMISYSLAQRLCVPHSLVWKYNGDFHYIDWEETSDKFAQIIREALRE